MNQTLLVKRVLLTALLLNLVIAPALAFDKKQRVKSEADFTAATAEFLKNRDIEQATKSFEAILAADPTYAKAMYNLATLEERRGNLDTAISWLERYLENENGSKKYRASAQGRLSALRDIKTGAYSDDDAYDDALFIAVDLLDQGNTERAYSEAMIAAGLNDQRFEAYAVAASALMQAGDFETADDFLKQALERAPAEQKSEIEEIAASAAHERDYKKHMAAGRRAQGDKNYARAAAAYAMAAALFPNRDASLVAGFAYALDQQNQRAEEFLTQAMQRGDNSTAQTAREHLSRLRGEAELAALDDKASGDIPGWGVYLDGLEALQDGDADRALQRFSAAIERVPVKREYALYFQMRGAAQLALGNAQHALADFGRALTIEPSLQEVHKLRALAYQRSGKRLSALQAYNEAIAQENYSQEKRDLRYERSKLNRALDNHWAAIQDLDYVLNEADGWPKIQRAKAHVARAVSYEHVGDKRAAMNDYARATKLGNVPSRVSNRLSELRDRWVVVMNKSKYFSSSFVSSKEPPFEQIKAAWKDNHDVEYVIYDQQQKRWLLGIAKDNPYNGQSYSALHEFPKYWIKEKLQTKQHITSLDYGDGRWFVVTSGEVNPGRQSLSVTKQFPMQAIRSAWGKGQKIQYLKYGGGEWAVVTGTKSDFGSQILIREQDWPEERIQRARREGYGVVTVGYGQGEYAIIMGKTDQPQRYTEGHSFPRNFIRKAWNDSFNIGAIIQIRQQVDS